MTDDTQGSDKTDAAIAAQNQAAADSANPTTGASPAIDASPAGQTSTATSSPSAVAASSGADTDPNVSGSGPAGALAGANTLSGADSTAGASDPNANAAASTSSATSTLSGSMANGNVAAAKADSDFINDPASQQPSLAGTSGKQGIDTGMATDAGTEKLTPAQATQAGSNLGVDAPNVNVRAVGAPHPIVYEIQKRIAELKIMISTQEKTPWVQRALKDLHTAEEWVIQHFEEMKRKL